jgi:integrase
VRYGSEVSQQTVGSRPCQGRRYLDRQRSCLHHGTRKTCASLLAALDVHPRVAMRILRHSKIAVTMEVYTEAPSAATRDALRKLGELFG